MLKVDATNMPPHLHRAIVTFERAIIELRYMVDNGDHLVETINSHLSTLLEMHEELPSMAGVKGKKYNRILDNFTWNVRILRGQVDLLESCRKECQQGLAQVTFVYQLLQCNDKTSIPQQHISELFHNCHKTHLQ
jgi:NAD-dependent SIR2 family protein deacetylase